MLRVWQNAKTGTKSDIRSPKTKWALGTRPLRAVHTSKSGSYQKEAAASHTIVKQASKGAEPGQSPVCCTEEGG